MKIVMALLSEIQSRLPVWKALLTRLLRWPQTFSKTLWAHLLVLAPLILAQFLQRLQDVVDNRYLGALGHNALEIHNVQFNFYSVGQEIGLAAAMSALLFWRRSECVGKQGSSLSLMYLCPWFCLRYWP
jgi:hypothetical protein